MAKTFLRLLLCGFAFLGWGKAAEFLPDPSSVQRYGPAYRCFQDGWIRVHIEGQPLERGRQHGHLLAPEILESIRVLALKYGPGKPQEGWERKRRLVRRLFLQGFDPEMRQEMKGIAEGAQEAGARLWHRALDEIDIATLNCVNELESLKDAPNVGPEDLEAFQGKAPIHAVNRPRRCNAFAAVGPATRDGRIVFGHVTMWDLYPGRCYNVWMEVVPTTGHRFVMQTSPGGMHSGMDFSINDAGILMSETTLAQTCFIQQGIPLACRIRRAEQYADSIDAVVSMLGTKSNGLSTSEWILADTKANEIALFTLGGQKTCLHRSSKNQWLGGAEGFYWSCNDDKDLEVRLETAERLDGKPSPAGAYEPCKRDQIWLETFQKHKGSIDEAFAREVLTRPELVAPISLDSKFTTSDLAKQLTAWAAFGPPSGEMRQPTPSEIRTFLEYRPMARHPWSLLRPDMPPPTGAPVVDLPAPLTPLSIPSAEPPLPPAWTGTLLPQTSKDLWLSTAFANYERIVALEKHLRKASGGTLSTTDRQRLGTELFYWRSVFELGSRAGTNRSLAQCSPATFDLNAFNLVTGKGVLLLHALHQILGSECFERCMNEFGRTHAGAEVSTEAFTAFMSRASNRDLSRFFTTWLNDTDLPRFQLGEVSSKQLPDGWITTLELQRNALGKGLVLPVSIRTQTGEVSASLRMEAITEHLQIHTDAAPLSVTVDPNFEVSRSGGTPFTVLSCENDLDQALIAYGTRNESQLNLDTARALQDALKHREFNQTVPILKDTEVSEEALATHHLFLVGRPDSNVLMERFQNALPVRFGPRSFKLGDETYAHPGTALLFATENPLQPRFSLVVAAGLGGESVINLVQGYQEEKFDYSPVLCVPYGRAPRVQVLPPPELFRVLSGSPSQGQPKP